MFDMKQQPIFSGHSMKSDIERFVDSKLYIAILDEFPDYMTPTLVAHTVMGAHIRFKDVLEYKAWLKCSFKKCVVRVNSKEFAKILELPVVYEGHEIHTLNGRTSCLIPLPCLNDELPNVLKFAKLWKPR